MRCAPMDASVHQKLLPALNAACQLTPENTDLSRVPNVTDWITEQIFAIGDMLTIHSVTSPIGASACSNKLVEQVTNEPRHLKKALVTGLRLLLRTMLNCINRPDIHAGYVYPQRFEAINDKVSASNAQTVVRTCGKVLNIIFREVVDDSEMIQDHDINIKLRVGVVGLVYVTSYIARCQKMTIPSVSERIVPYIFDSITPESENRLATWALFCAACICKPDDQWRNLNNVPPVFDITWKKDSNSSLMRFLSQGYIRPAPLISTLCSVMNNDPTLTEGQLESVINIVHGASLLNLTVARSIVAHPELLDLLLKEALIFFQSTDDISSRMRIAFQLDEALRALYKSLDDLFDNGILLNKLVSSLLRTPVTGDHMYLKLCIDLWEHQYTTGEGRKPFALDILKVYLGDVQKTMFTPRWSHRRRSVIDELHKLNVNCQWLMPAYVAAIDSIVKGMHKKNDKVDWVSKGDELKQNLRHIQTICNFFSFK
ncbi:hypothetical protein CVT24_004640 [Panaeolus cyanescens]|uniref:Uncharacterized protein n=1 Tax=Panaeolus cyanescens TaxID=181874 RepID=A0A409YSH6_9AGAR|nr:hypothetical protein CVT24_004640 [Panaeolus cyanescens]